MKAIANAKLFIGKTSGPWKNVEISISAPEIDPKSKNGDYRCRVHLKGITPPTWIYGLDSLQALGLAFRSIKSEVEAMKSKGLRLFFTRDADEPDLFLVSYFGDLQDAPPDLKKGMAKAKRRAKKV